MAVIKGRNMRRILKLKEKKKSLRLGALAALLLFTAACSPAGKAASSQPTAGGEVSGSVTEAVSPVPSETPTSSASPTPEPSPTPTETPTPTGTPTPLPPTETPAPTAAPGATVTLAPSVLWDDSAVDVSWIDPSKPVIALTFDDGPAGSSSDRIMDVLEKYHCHATFFYVGDRLNSYKSKVRRAYSLGCEVANHSYTHSNLRKLSEEEIRAEIEKTNRILQELTGETQFLVRCPGGNANNLVKNTVHAPILYWSVDTEDWRSRDCDKVVSRVLGKVRDGDIVLMHELYQSTADAAEIIVPELVKQGYQLVTVSELMKIKGISMETGVVYYHAR